VITAAIKLMLSGRQGKTKIEGVTSSGTINPVRAPEAVLKELKRR